MEYRSGHAFALAHREGSLEEGYGAAELKDLREFHEREAVLKGALIVNARAIAGKRMVLLDDLIRSGATLGAVAAALTDAGAAIICAFAFTKTQRG